MRGVVAAAQSRSAGPWRRARGSTVRQTRPGMREGGNVPTLRRQLAVQHRYRCHDDCRPAKPAGSLLKRRCMSSSRTDGVKGAPRELLGSSAPRARHRGSSIAWRGHRRASSLAEQRAKWPSCESAVETGGGRWRGGILARGGRPEKGAVFASGIAHAARNVCVSQSDSNDQTTSETDLVHRDRALLPPSFSLQPHSIQHALLDPRALSRARVVRPKSAELSER